jgi:hypothetical protein
MEAESIASDHTAGHAACSTPWQKPQARRQAMFVPTHVDDYRSAPALDAARPDEVRTATFALG